MSAIDGISEEVKAELVRARGIFGPMRSAHEGYAVLLEEVDELWDEVRHDRRPGAVDRMRAEAIQVAAMAMRFLIDVCAESGTKAGKPCPAYPTACSQGCPDTDCAHYPRCTPVAKAEPSESPAPTKERWGVRWGARGGHEDWAGTDDETQPGALDYKWPAAHDFKSEESAREFIRRRAKFVASREVEYTVERLPDAPAPAEKPESPAHCGDPHPSNDGALCDLPIGHDGWHVAYVGRGAEGSTWAPCAPPVAPAPAEKPAAYLQLWIGSDGGDGKKRCFENREDAERAIENGYYVAPYIPRAQAEALAAALRRFLDGPCRGCDGVTTGAFNMVRAALAAFEGKP